MSNNVRPESQEGFSREEELAYFEMMQGEMELDDSAYWQDMDGPEDPIDLYGCDDQWAEFDE